MLRLIFLLLIALLTAAPCEAQTATATSLREASFLWGTGRATDAIERYRHIIDTAGDELTPVEPPLAALALLAGAQAYAFPWPSYHYLPARWICHDEISRFPAAALQLYRNRVDSAASRQLADFRERPSDRGLETLLAEAFNSRSGEDAILLLAQRAFDRGDFHRAIYYWRMLLPRQGSGLHFPDPRTPAAYVEARLILTHLFCGQTKQAAQVLKAFPLKYPKEKGLLAGRDQVYAETLAELMKKPQMFELPAPPNDGREWFTFGSNFERNSSVTRGLPYDGLSLRTWMQELGPKRVDKLRDQKAAFAPDDPRALVFFPVIAQGRVFVCDAMQISSFHLGDGRLDTRFDLRERLPIPGIDRLLPVRSDVRHTLTYADSFLYARLGSQVMRPTAIEPGEQTDDTASAIVALGPISNKKAGRLTHAWTLRPPVEKETTSVFEGTPVVTDGKLYALMRRQTGGDTSIEVVCYQVRGIEGLPELIWHREVAKPILNPASEVRGRHDLLTLAGQNLVASGNSRIVAIEAHNGKPAWEYRYLRNERRPAPVGRDLCPCLFQDGRVFAAPTDSDRLFCLDAYTGRLLWDREGVDVIHLLGVAQNRLIATFAGAVPGIRGLDIASGSEFAPDGWVQHVNGGSATFGRGFVAPNMIYWPTKEGLQFLSPEDGRILRQPLPGVFGNMAYADGSIIFTNATEMTGYVKGR